MSLISQILQQIDDEEKQAGEYQCFVGHEFRHRDLRNKLELALSRLQGMKLQPYFADSEVSGGFILEKICKKILVTRATIVDLTTSNPNVYFELGVAIGLNKPIFVILKQNTTVPMLLENFVKLHFTSYTELEKNLIDQIPGWLVQSIEYHLRYNSHCHFVNILCPDRLRISPQRRYLLIDHLKVVDDTTQPAYDQDLQQELLPALERFHFKPTFPYKIPLESSFRLCDYCRSLRDSSFALCHLTRYSSLDVYFLLGLATGLGIPSLLVVHKKEPKYSGQSPFEIPSMLRGLDLFEYEHYTEISKRLGNEVEGFLNMKKYKPIAGRILAFPDAYRREITASQQEAQEQTELEETTQAVAHPDLQQKLLTIEALSDPGEQQRALTQISQELVDQGNVAGLREVLKTAQTITQPAQQAQALVTVIKALTQVHDTEGIRRVVEVVLAEESDDVRGPILEAVAHTYEMLGELEKARELLAFRVRKVPTSNPFAGLGVLENLNLFVGREEVLRRIWDRLKAGGNLSIIGPGGSGKTSILRLIEAKSDSEMSSQTQIVWFPLQRNMKLMDAQRTLANLLGGPKAKASDLITLLEGKHLILLLDELGQLDKGERGLEVRLWLRQLSQDRTLATVQLVSTSLRPLKEVFKKDESDDYSPLHNVMSDIIGLGAFSNEEARHFVIKALEGTPFSLQHFIDLLGKPISPRELQEACFARYDELVARKEDLS